MIWCNYNYLNSNSICYNIKSSTQRKIPFKHKSTAHVYCSNVPVIIVHYAIGLLFPLMSGARLASTPVLVVLSSSIYWSPPSVSTPPSLSHSPLPHLSLILHSPSLSHSPLPSYSHQISFHTVFPSQFSSSSTLQPECNRVSSLALPFVPRVQLTSS